MYMSIIGTIKYGCRTLYPSLEYVTWRERGGRDYWKKRDRDRQTKQNKSK